MVEDINKMTLLSTHQGIFRDRGERLRIAGRDSHPSIQAGIKHSNISRRHTRVGDSSANSDRAGTYVNAILAKINAADVRISLFGGDTNLDRDRSIQQIG